MWRATKGSSSRALSWPFVLGMLWKRATAAGAIASIVVGVLVSYTVQPLYLATLAENESIRAIFGPEKDGGNLSFLYAVFAAFLASLATHVAVSLATQPDREKQKLTWIGLGVFTARQIQMFFVALLVSCCVYAMLAVGMVGEHLPPWTAGLVAGAWTAGVMALPMLRGGKVALDRVLACGLAACAIFMMFFFY